MASVIGDNDPVVNQKSYRLRQQGLPILDEFLLHSQSKKETQLGRSDLHRLGFSIFVWFCPAGRKKTTS
jgi:hypothetical protein